MTPYESLAAVRPTSSSTEGADYGSFCHFAVLTRNYGDGFTAAFCTFAFNRRNFADRFTAAFRNFPFCRRNYAADLAAAFRAFAFCRRKFAVPLACSSLIRPQMSLNKRFCAAQI